MVRYKTRTNAETCTTQQSKTQILKHTQPKRETEGQVKLTNETNRRGTTTMGDDENKKSVNDRSTNSTNDDRHRTTSMDSSLAVDMNDSLAESAVAPPPKKRSKLVEAQVKSTSTSSISVENTTIAQSVPMDVTTPDVKTTNPSSTSLSTNGSKSHSQQQLSSSSSSSSRNNNHNNHRTKKHTRKNI